MNSQSYISRRLQSSEASPFPSDENFDFSLWSRLVKEQMVSTLQKRQRNR
ncbi:MAG TPA: hypothetical protein ACFE0H_01225 [Elainellaceae cyanobacterium]